MKRILLALVILFAIALPVHAQDQETVEPALATAVSDQLATDFPLMTQTAAAALTPTVEAVEPAPVDNSVNVTIEQPPEPPVEPAPVDNTQTYLFILAVIAIAVIAAMGYLMERKDPQAAARLYEDALRRAYETKQTPYDEVGLEAWLTLRGFKVSRDADGTLHVTAPISAQKIGTPLDVVP